MSLRQTRARNCCAGLVRCLHNPHRTARLGLALREHRTPHFLTHCSRADPTSGEASKVEEIGNKMADQYKRWQPKIKCKQALDPTFEDVKKLCSALRRRAKDEPVLFHYNGLGVPRPTQNGELWVFNRSYTQYGTIPSR